MLIYHETRGGFHILHILPEGFQTPDPPRDLWFTSDVHQWEIPSSSDLRFPMEPSGNNNIQKLSVKVPVSIDQIEFKIYDKTYDRYCEPFGCDGTLYRNAGKYFVRNAFGTFNLRYKFSASL